MNKARPIQSFFSMLLVCLICAMAVTIVYEVTAPRIEELELARSNEARAAVLPGANGFTKVEDIELLDGVTEVYRANNNSGYAVTARAKGSSGYIETITGIDAGGVITGVKVTDVSGEISGLGTNVTLADYTDQYTGARAITADPTDPGAAYIEAAERADEASMAVFTCVSNSLLQVSGMGTVI
ncbi:MAG: hypothetical protein II971_04325 [Firmicutes bacterium]|nr:hypothetical protein [Bacillota bacterium]